MLNASENKEPSLEVKKAIVEVFVNILKKKELEEKKKRFLEIMKNVKAE